MRVVSRVAGAASRRTGRPELLALVDAHARQAQREELAMKSVLAAVLHRGATYVDVGANRGQVLREAVRVAPGGRHVAFEPIPGLAAELARSFPQVDCRQRALGARAGNSQFCHFTRLDGWSGLRRSPDISDERARPEYIDVQVSTLDDELEGIAPAVLKIDVEGAELAVLQGGSSTIARARPLIVFEHCEPASALYGVAGGELWDLLAQLSYEVFAVTGEGPFTRAEFGRAAGVVNWLARPCEAG